MSIRLKNRRELGMIYQSGQITGEVLAQVGERVRPGVSTASLDEFAATFIGKHGAKAAFLGYRGFPASICVSVNDEVVHGIPGSRVIQSGDLVSVDVGVVLNGFYSDAARTFVAGEGEPCPDTQRLLNGTEQSLKAGIAAMSEGKLLRDVCRAIGQVLAGNKLGIIRDLTGHGVGFQLHEEPTVPNFDPGPRRQPLQAGLVIAIEPMASLGSERILLAADNWTYRTADGSLAAHYEHTVGYWDNQAWVLTDPTDEKSRAEFAS